MDTYEQEDEVMGRVLGWVWVVCLLGCAYVGVSPRQSSCAAAPAPNAKPVQQLEVTPGEWVIEWNTNTYRVVLTDAGVLDWDNEWKGVWRWDGKTSTFHSTDYRVSDSERTYTWSVTLDKDGRGVSKGEAWTGTKVRIRKVTTNDAPRPIRPIKVTD